MQPSLTLTLTPLPVAVCQLSETSDMNRLSMFLSDAYSNQQRDLDARQSSPSAFESADEQQELQVFGSSESPSGFEGSCQPAVNLMHSDSECAALMSNQHNGNCNQSNSCAKRNHDPIDMLANQLQLSPQMPPNATQNSKTTIHKSDSQGSSSGLGTNLTQTISQSMLELDSKAMSNFKPHFRVTWKNFTFSHPSSYLNLLLRRRDIRAPVLNNLSGSIESNQLVAIIGPSGCGKTTLLQFLSGTNKAYSDCIKITGIDEPKVSFIGQGDCLLPNLTTQETLIYASRLQNPKRNFDHQKHVEPVLKGLGLAECAHRNVTKLSGGQVKRVIIGQELLYPTNLLILDEITSGLDASTSYSIVKLLKQLASDTNYPMAIVMSIHQPSAKLFSEFDRVYVMSQGCCLYDGSCDIETINTRLKQFELECPKFHNIADYLIEIASDDLGADCVEVKQRLIEFQRSLTESSSIDSELNGRYSRERRNNFANHELEPLVSSKHTQNLAHDQDQETRIDFRQSTDNTSGDREERAEHEVQNDAGADDDDCQMTIGMLSSSPMDTQSWNLYEAVEKARNSRVRPFFHHFIVHLSRSNLRVMRSRILTYLQLTTYILLGLQVGTFFGSNIGTFSGCPKLPMSFVGFILSNDSEDTVTAEMRSLQEQVNLMLVSVMTVTFAALEITVITFPLEAKTVKREWRNGRYRVSSYFMGRSLADFPFQILCVFIFSLIIYLLTHQIGLFTWRFAMFLVIMLMVALIAQAVGFVFGAIFMDNLPAAVFSAPLFIFPNLLFSGFFARVSQIPQIYQLIAHGSHFQYVFDSLLVTLYGGRCECDQSALDKYHESLTNQTQNMREMFRSMIGSSSCPVSPAPSDENSIEDTTGFSGDINSIIVNETTTINPLDTTTNLTGSLMSMKMIATSTTERPSKHFEDALVETVFEHISKTENSGSMSNTSAVDYLMNQFSSRVTDMFNTRNNFGRPVPTHCNDLNSYLMGEFEVQEKDLIVGLVVLVSMVLVSRIICNLVLNMTMRG